MSNPSSDKDVNQVGWRHTLLPTLSLFTALSTLLCCALPAFFVALGAGAVLAGLVSELPWLVTLTRHKIELFSGAAVLLVIAGVMQWRARHLPCPADPAQARACQRIRTVSKVIYAAACLMYAVGFTYAFVLARLAEWF